MYFMNMCMVRLFSILNLFFVCLLVKHEISVSFVQYFPHQDIWFDAQKFCNDNGGRLATKEDSYDSLSCSRVQGIESSGLTYWTGKYKTISHWISRIGCYTILWNPNVLSANSVSRCFEVCMMQHSRIQLLAHIETKCVCILENMQSLEGSGKVHQCNQTQSSYNNFWTYTVTQNTTLNGSGNCAFVDCLPKPEIKTASCATARAPFCDTSELLNWNMSENRCKYHILGHIGDICKTVTTSNASAWLPIQRVAFWTKVTSDGVTMDKAEYITECQSYRCYNNEATPHLANTSCSEKTTGFFCAFASSYNMTTEKMKTFTESAVLFPGTYSSKFTNLNTHDTHTRPLNEDRFSVTTSIKVKQNDNRTSTAFAEHHATSNMGLIIGGVLGALAICGVVILIVMIRLRRKNASTKNNNVEQSEISNDDHQRNNRSNNTRVNQLYEDEGARADRPVPVRTKESEIANEQEEKTPNDVYAVVMKNSKPSHLQFGLKPVVASAEVVESEYDRLNITPNFLADNMENNVYDSSIADRCESDPTYNTATNIRHSRTNTEDVYN